MAYILRARENRTLKWHGKDYGDGDPIPISKGEAEKIALQFRGYRFEEKSGGAEISFDSIDAATSPETANSAVTVANLKKS